MRTLPINKAMSYLAPSLLTAGLFVSSTLLAMPLQGNLATSAKPTREVASPTRTEIGSLTKSPVLVRNTTTKIDPVATTTTAVPSKSQDKKAMSRCWKRLMSMVREMNHAHHTKSDGTK